MSKHNAYSMLLSILNVVILAGCGKTHLTTPSRSWLGNRLVDSAGFTEPRALASGPSQAFFIILLKEQFDSQLKPARAAGREYRTKARRSDIVVGQVIVRAI